MAIKKRPREGMVENRSIASKIGTLLVTLIVIFLAVVAVLPMWHVLMSSLSNGHTLLSYDGFAVIPIGGFNINAYKLILQNQSIIQGYLNTIIYVVATVGLGLIINVLGGYVLYCNTKLNTFLSLLVMFTMMFSGGMVPSYMVLNGLGLTGSRIAIILSLATNAMYIIVASNAFRGVPRDTVEAAYLDGAGHLTIMFRVMLPQCMSLMSVTILNTFIGSWNSWVEASIYVGNDRSKWPIQLVINDIVQQNANILTAANPNYDRYLIQYAVIVIAVLPILIAFPFFQDKIEAGVLTGAVKG